jgi:hypothetical protein
MSINYYDKYIKYKHKYITLSNQIGGGWKKLRELYLSKKPKKKIKEVKKGYIFLLSDDNITNEVKIATQKQIDEVNIEINKFNKLNFLEQHTSVFSKNNIEKTSNKYDIYTYAITDTNTNTDTVTVALFCEDEQTLINDIKDNLIVK